MALKARVLYDFTSENPGEISVREGELVNVFSEEELDGWLEGENSRGEAGLFPASYVELVQEQVAPNSSSSTTSNNGLASFSNSSTRTKGPMPGHTPYTSTQASDEDDDWDDDWDDPSPVTAKPVAPTHLGTVTPAMHVLTTSSSAGRRQSTQSQSHGKSSTATVGRNLNRFSTFVKSGGEAFLLGEASAFVSEGERICVAMGEHGPEWQENPHPFTCTIDDPTKQTKFKGMKSYMSYGLTPSHTNVLVNRR